MKNINKVIENEFVWLPLEKRKSKFGGPMTPRKAELRKPLLWLTRKNESLYLVNGSDEPFDSIIISSGGFTSNDGDGVTSYKGQGDEYENLHPNTGIKVDQFDSLQGCDLIVQMHLRVKSLRLGCIDIRTILGRKKIKETVLVWDTGEGGKDVFVKSLHQAQCAD
ncbi:hypothetical protein [Litorilituus lipolyticus]|uniref:Uncharacterized protein n=1 Tax=Litorilituus lipolyticus TaxID=2491017 RepID=A0A502KUF8_9GAMM|nr:hypothetical protein [Litorilituus lipolyticus]TPH13263.1 hypothetical protein EPA86_13800 [Litorilituus lipolyticus]